MRQLVLGAGLIAHVKRPFQLAPAEEQRLLLGQAHGRFQQWIVITFGLESRNERSD